VDGVERDTELGDELLHLVEGQFIKPEVGVIKASESPGRGKSFSQDSR
jgi:hypothetical protein